MKTAWNAKIEARRCSTSLVTQTVDKCCPSSYCCGAQPAHRLAQCHPTRKSWLCVTCSYIDPKTRESRGKHQDRGTLLMRLSLGTERSGRLRTQRKNGWPGNPLSWICHTRMCAWLKARYCHTQSHADGESYGL